jgi:hypothetical protein
LQLFIQVKNFSPAGLPLAVEEKRSERRIRIRLFQLAILCKPAFQASAEARRERTVVGDREVERHGWRPIRGPVAPLNQIV